MNFRKVFAALLSLCALNLIACSGSPKPCTANCGPTGTATLSVTLTAVPLAPPPNTNLLSFFVDINTITLTPATGAAVNIPLNATAIGVDLTKLQSDSIFLGTATKVPAGTYSNITVSISNPVVTFCTQTLGNTGCAPGSIATLSGGAAATPKITSAPFPLTLSANEKTGLAINFNLANALTVNTSQVVTAVNLAATNALSANSLPATATSLTTGQLDFLEDVTGVVTAINATTQSVTVQTSTRGSLTAIANSSTVLSPNCTTFNLNLTFSSCIVQGHVASLDMVLNSDGTFTLVEYDPLATATGDWVEGIVTVLPSSSTQFQIITNDTALATTNSLLGTKLVPGTPANVTLVSPSPFLVDTKGLTVPATTFGGTDASILRPGQAVAVHVTSFTAASGTPPTAAANADTLFLRFTRVTGSLTSPAAPNVSIQSLPPFFGLTSPVQVQLSAGAVNTNYDGVSSSAGLSSGQTVSIRALYFGSLTVPAFSAAKVRTH
jgi:hypothetical protein